MKQFPNLVAYCTSKAAIDQLTKCIALDLGERGVRVNAVNPGVIVTDIHKRAGMSEKEYAEVRFVLIAMLLILRVQSNIGSFPSFPLSFLRSASKHTSLDDRELLTKLLRLLHFLHQMILLSPQEKL